MLKETITKMLLSLLILFSTNIIVVNADVLELTSKSAIVMDVETGEVIYEYNSQDKRQMASTTKLMTALILAENKDKSDKITLTKNAISMPSTSFTKDYGRGLLTAGTQMYAEDVMNALLLISGNDMAVAIAENISGTQEDFSNLMDNRAKEIGMLNTDFFTATGLDTDSVLKGHEHHSTAYDMALLGLEASKNQWVRESMGINVSDISIINGNAYTVENSNKNLSENGCIGGKTGYTTKAQRCLVALYERDGRELLGVVLGGSNPGFFNDMNKIMDYSYEQVREVMYNSNETISKIETNVNPFIVGDSIKLEIPVYSNEDISMYNNEFNLNNSSYDVEYDEINPWNLKKGEKVGKIIVKEKNRVKEYSLCSEKSTFDLLMENKMFFIKKMLLILGVIILIWFLNKVRHKRN